jgi:hypothetical protein
MFSEQLKKILNLIKKTGDRVVVFDANSPDESYVVMDFDRYANMVSGQDVAVNLVNKPVFNSPEKSVKSELSQINNDLIAKKENLTEEDLTDKINREISMWKNQENGPYLAEEDKPKKAWSIPSQVKNKAQEIE